MLHNDNIPDDACAPISLSHRAGRCTLSVSSGRLPGDTRKCAGKGLYIARNRTPRARDTLDIAPRYALQMLRAAPRQSSRVRPKTASAIDAKHNCFSPSTTASLTSFRDCPTIRQTARLVPRQPENGCNLFFTWSYVTGHKSSADHLSWE